MPDKESKNWQGRPVTEIVDNEEIMAQLIKMRALYPEGAMVANPEFHPERALLEDDESIEGKK